MLKTEPHRDFVCQQLSRPLLLCVQLPAFVLKDYLCKAR